MKHLKVLNVLNKIFAVFYFLLAAGILYLAAEAMQTGSMVAAGIPLLMGCAVAAVGVVTWMLGGKLTSGRWKTGQIVLAALSLPSVPLGTAYGAYALWVCLGSDEAKAAYEEMAELDVFA